MAMVSPASAAPFAGPCAPARSEVQTRCAEAERLAQAALAHQQRLRDVRRQMAEMVALRDSDARIRDRRQLDAAKADARTSYQAAMARARAVDDVHEAARVWLREIDRLNRQLTLADGRAEDVVRRANELERSLPGVELAADAARIAAEAAQAACLDARGALASCEEDAQRRTEADPGAAVEVGASGPIPADASANASIVGSGTPPVSAPATAGVSGSAGTRPITLVLRGDRQTLHALALRLADETGVEAGRLQLLLLELREAISARALEEHALRFAPNQPFWSQLPASSGRQIAAGLASLGYRFDGAGGWLDGRSPTLREFTVALANVGLDARALRRPVGQEGIDALWRGTSVLVEEYLAARAPDLDLQQVTACLGPRAASLSELWDIWGRLRVLLLTPA